MMIPGFQPFEGEHCETVAIGNLLKHRGLQLSEPMLFGIGAGLGFIYWKLKSMPVPFLGGRTKALGRNLCGNLGVQMEERETSSSAKAWRNVAEFLDAGEPVALQLDCFHLDYFSNKIHFAGHHVAMVGYEAELAHLVDTRPQGTSVTTSLDSLAKARREKGPMSARNRSATISFDPAGVDLESAIVRGIRANAAEFLNPPIQNLGYRGIKKTAAEIGRWYAASADPRADFAHAAMMMERAGTGGALFRNLYRDFLQEAGEVTGLDGVREGHERFVGIAAKWSEVARLFERVAATGESEPLDAAADLLNDLSELERAAMQDLADAVPR